VTPLSSGGRLLGRLGEAAAATASDAVTTASATATSIMPVSMDPNAPAPAPARADNTQHERRQTFVFKEVVFGVTSKTSSRAGGSSAGNAPFFGLVKERAGWIRPTVGGCTTLSPEP
jgi:hypothetical protein